MSHFEGHFEGVRARDNLGVKKVKAPSKCTEKWRYCPKKKIMSQSFLNSGTLVILCPSATPKFKGSKSLGPLKMSLEMAHKVIDM